MSPVEMLYISMELMNWDVEIHPTDKLMDLGLK